MTFRKSKLAFVLADCVAALAGTAIVASYLPFSLLLHASTPTGGDNPAHPVLIRSIEEALRHGSIVHYSYLFWSGFEAFRFYFPVPYLLGALLNALLPLGQAYTWVTVLPALLLPPSFYFLARGAGLARLSALLSSLLAVSFFHTKAHTIWGGNIFSTMAGMFANAWGFVFLSLAIGSVVYLRRVDDPSRLSVIGAVILHLLTIGSHFYSFLLLIWMHGVLLTVDLIQNFFSGTTSRRWRRSLFCVGTSVLLMGWWLIPLIGYRSYAADFGGDWEISLLRTLSIPELWFFGGVGIAALLILMW
ncbi:MAG: hypothetical protein KDD44_14415, partial [Bdellovibrionales bacterium]|nr:hypothetical protein [Bdellovibrionales bacterium]